MAFFKKRRFCPHRPERPLRPSFPKGPMGSKTAILEMKPLTALLSGGSQNGIFQKTPFLPSQANQAVKSLFAKRTDGVQNGHFRNEALNGLTSLRESKWHFSKNAVFPSQARKAVKTLISKRADGVQNGHFGNEAFNGHIIRRGSKWHFSKNAVFVPHRPVRPLRAFSPKGPMESKTALLEIKPLTALLSGESQNGIFQKTPFLPSQASQAVKSLFAKRAEGVQNGHFGNEALNGLIGRRVSKWHFSKNAVFARTGQKGR